MGANRMIVHLDSHLVAQQLEGTYEVKNDWLRRYIEAYENLKIEFQEVILQKVPRVKNKKADELAQMARVITHWVEEDVVTWVELIAQVDQILPWIPTWMKRSTRGKW